MNGHGRNDKTDLRAKAAYLMVKGSVGEDLVSKEELAEALQNAGYNPTLKTICKHWTQSTERMTFSQFSYLTEVEPLPSHNDLLAAFEKLDDKGQGYLNHDSFLMDMTTRGEKLPSEALKHVLSDKTFSAENKFDYRTFCKAVFETSEHLSDLAVDKYKQDEELSMVNSQTYKVKRKKSLPSPKTQKLSTPRSSRSPETVFMSSSKGSFYFEGENIISHQYLITIDQSAKVKISIKPENCHRSKLGLADTQVYIFDEHKRFLCRTEENLSNGAWQWVGRLEKGRYLAIPFTSGARLKRRDSWTGVQVPIVNRQPKIGLTKEFQLLLSEIYSQIDLDGNGFLSRKEFNLFNWRTSGEEVADEEWNVVEENFPLVSGELTLEGFLALHQMEAEDNDGDDTELWVTVNAMGYNRSLEQDESAGFTITVESSKTEHTLLVSGLKSGGLLLEKTVTRCAIDAAKEPTKIRGTSNILIYREITPTRVTVVVQNKSESTARVELDLRESEGLVTSRDSMLSNITVTKKSSLIAAHLLPVQDHLPWKVRLQERIVK